MNFPFKFYCQKVIPLAFDESMSYYETLCALTSYIKDTLIPAVNENANAIVELQNLYTELKEYVDNYFENLDIQTEINNKLDQMAEDGTLANIISQYIQLESLLIYDNVADMCAATNVVNGSTCETLGFYTKGDNGAAKYKIRTIQNTDIVNNINLFAITNDNILVAELIVDHNNINICQFGAKHNENCDTIMTYILSILEDGDTVFVPNGYFKFTNPIEINKVVTFKGTSNVGGYGSIFEFDNCNGIVLKKNYIKIENIYVYGIHKPESSEIDISNNEFGTIGIHCEYTDTYTNGGVKINNVSVTNFNCGVVLNSTRTNNKWSGAYRNFENCLITYNDYGYVILDGATFNKILYGNISSNTIYGIYATTETFYQNIEMIGTALEVNGYNSGFYNEVYNSFGIYTGKETKLKCTSCYFENMSIFADYNSKISFENCHIHSNVPIFGGKNASIDSINSHNTFANKFNFGTDIPTDSTNTGLTVSQMYANTSTARIQSSNSGDNRLNLPNIYTIAIPLKDITTIKFEIDVKVRNGYQNSNFGIKPLFNMAAYSGSPAADSSSIGNFLALKNVQPINNEWSHLTYFWNPRFTNSYFTDMEAMIYRLSAYLFFTNDLASDTSDFTTNNLDMYIANPQFTIYSSTNYNN